jgi:predicted phage gp36 major capsid-like protein
VDATALNAFAVAFGNFRRGYILRDHAAAGMRVSPSFPLSVELRLT